MEQEQGIMAVVEAEEPAILQQEQEEQEVKDTMAELATRVENRMVEGLVVAWVYKGQLDTHQLAAMA
jgi:hypothetical protein